MKHILLGAFSLMIILTACNNKTKESATSNDYEDAIKNSSRSLFTRFYPR